VFYGSNAVSFFFVLSGFVLSCKYIVLDAKLDIGKFYVNRLFRLWPAYFVIIVLNTFNVSLHDLSLYHLKEIFLLNKMSFLKEAFLPRGTANLYAPGWTLIIELALSFLIPFTIVLAKKNARLLLWLLVAYLFIGNTMRDLYLFNIHFTLGVLISCLYGRVSNTSFRETKYYKDRYTILLLCFLLYSVRHIGRLSAPPAVYTYVTDYLGITFFHYTGVASFVFIIAMLVSRSIQKILTNKILLFTGKISYGIYLAHWMLVVDVFRYWDKILPLFSGPKVAFVSMFFIYCIVTFLVATVLHYTVELPCIKAGKYIAGRMRPSPIV
jgi:peptidoglycan/LPS O-acetylase OafA/YrhL